MHDTRLRCALRIAPICIWL